MSVLCAAGPTPMVIVKGGEASLMLADDDFRGGILVPFDQFKLWNPEAAEELQRAFEEEDA